MRDARFWIGPASSGAGMDAVRRLFSAYAASLEIDLAYQNFAAELAGLPGQYAPPAGALLLARGLEGGNEAEPLGCVALRPMPANGCCEMKRLYVSPRGRGLGLGRALVEAIVAEALRIGYREMRLDTLPSMAGAIALYRKAGFTPTEPYYDTPVADTIFLARPLAT
ncbi:GNAT family N-acetyltransferase [Roseomonas xinghualingensis]|uniref:GNAT family N-acetyltransferase n=1 Tax=Roseomonas xinghualingensis TaxID=2986475 RepID=UPI0021F21885|nr:GNAT family N-acetyltransferase [Roseomonas sp. SXEYE001]MCV4207904.1 GNAT family N-acetyltransferase [Roseomonas sp. SXEYE001]